MLWIDIQPIQYYTKSHDKVEVSNKCKKTLYFMNCIFNFGWIKVATHNGLGSSAVVEQHKKYMSSVSAHIL